MFDFLNTDKKQSPKLSVIIPAAGSSRRMGGENKLLMELQGVPVIAHTLSIFNECPTVGEIIVVAREEDIPILLDIANAFEISKLKTVLCGGATRQQSVMAGVNAIATDCRYVCIHDGARPLVTQEVIANTVEMALLHGAATAAVPVKDTIKVVSPEGFVTQTPVRSTLFAVQTPQIFAISLYKKALENALENNLDFTDDCQLIEAVGERVYIAQGDYCNIKITTPEDLASAAAFLEDMFDD